MRIAPERNIPLAGEDTGYPLTAWVNTTASLENESKFGVFTTSFPLNPKASPRNWSAITTSKLGRSE